MEWVKLKAGLDLGCILLQGVFKARWLRFKGAEWQGAASATEFIKQEGRRCKLMNLQKGLLKAGKVEAWDVTLLCNLLLDADWPPATDTQTSIYLLFLFLSLHSTSSR